MPTLTIVQRSGTERTIQGSADRSVMENIRVAGISDVLALCGGSCACGTCHVYVDERWWAEMPQMSSNEDELLSISTFRRDTSRLSCQIPFSDAMDGLRVTIAPEE
jgi:ferredoxin, 2Fe-2S